MSIKIGAMLAVAAMVLGSAAAIAQQATANPTTQTEEGKLSPNWIHASVPNGFTLVAAGDLIITEAISPMMKRKSPDLIKLLQSADVTFENYEDTAIDLRKFGGYPEALAGGRVAHQLATLAARSQGNGVQPRRPGQQSHDRLGRGWHALHQ